MALKLVRAVRTALFFWLAALAGCSSAKAPEGQANAARNERPARVSVAETSRGELTGRWTFFGDVRSLMSAELAAGAEARVMRVTVRAGDRVKRGQLLVQLDLALPAAKLQRAKARLARATEEAAQAARELQRFERLSKQARTELEVERSRSKMRQQKLELDVLRADVQEARAELELYGVRAPFAGLVSRRHVDPGDWVKRGEKVLDVVSVGELEVVVDVSPKLLGYVHTGDRAVVHGGDGGELEARVAGVVGALDRVARTARLRLTCKKQAPWLRPGAPVRASFAVKRSGVGVVVPRDALLTSQLGSRLVLVVGGKARFVDVDVLATAGQRALVVAKKRAQQLRPGQKVVTRGNERLQPGQRLEVTGG